MWNNTEIKHCRRCSREITVILFQFYFMLCEPLLQYYRILCLVHTADRDKTRLSCLVGGVTRVGDNLRQFSVVLNYIVSWTVFSSPVCIVWTRLQTSPAHAAFRDWTKLQNTTLNIFCFEIFCRRQFYANSVHTVDMDTTAVASPGMGNWNTCHPPVCECMQILQPRSNYGCACILPRS